MRLRKWGSIAVLVVVWISAVAVSWASLPMGAMTQVYANRDEVSAKALSLVAAPDNAVPQTIGELTSGIETGTYMYTADEAANLQIPVAGTLQGGGDQRIFVKNFIVYKECTADNGDKVDYGIGIRWTVNVSSITAKLGLTFPAIAANAQVNGMQAQVHFAVVGTGLSSLWEPANVPMEMNVQNYVVMQRSFDKCVEILSKLAHDAPGTAISPAVVARIRPTSAVDRINAQATIMSLRDIAAGKTLALALADWQKATAGLTGADRVAAVSAVDGIRTVYCDVAGTMPTESPDQQARKTANRYLSSMGVPAP